MSVEYNGIQYDVHYYKDGRSYLDLSNKNIGDISAIKRLENLTNLKELNLRNNQIKEINGLEHLENLEILDLRENQITELKGLETLRNLKTLDLMNNQIFELKGLENLKNLKMFTVYGNPVYDWIQKKLGGDYRKAEVVVNYCAMVKGQPFNKNNVENLMQQRKWEIALKIQKKAYFDVVELLLDIYIKVMFEDRTPFYDFFGKILVEHPDLFKRKFLKNYDFLVQKLSIKEVIEMESYVIDNYCTFQNEKVEIFILGVVDLGKATIRGRIYFTHLRIFTFGVVETKSSGGGGGSGTILDLLLIPVAIGSALSTQKAKSMVKKSLKTSQELPRFGYQFPLLKARYISIKGTLIEIKTGRLKIRIQSSQYLVESQQSYLKRVEDIFSNIQNLFTLR